MKHASALLLGLIGWLVPMSAQMAGGPGLAQKILSPDAVLARATQLNLSIEQRSAVEREQKAQREILSELFTSTRRAADVLTDELSREKPDEATVLARFDELNTAETRLKRERLKTTVRLKHILDAAQLAQLESAPKKRSAEDLRVDSPHPTLPDMLQQVRAGIGDWKRSGRDMTEINALWAKFRLHADAREHQEARKTLQELLTKLSAPPTAPKS